MTISGRARGIVRRLSSPSVLQRPLKMDSLSDAQLALLADLQGNILKGHGRSHVRLLFARFGSAEAGRRLVGSLAPNVTSAWAQAALAERYRRYTDGSATPPAFLTPPFVSLALSAGGYRALQVPTDLSPQNGPFNEGLHRRAKQLGFPEDADWLGHLRGDVHAVIVLAYGATPEDAHRLDGDERSMRSSILESGNAILASEAGSVRYAGGYGKGSRRPIEPFGYVDGISQPKLVADSSDRDATYRSTAPLSTALVRCGAGQSAYSHGSYFIFERLQQHVDAFRYEMRRDPHGLSPERAGAELVGRFPDGTPRLLSTVPVNRTVPDNGFTYAADPTGMTCPRDAHIRLANPRTGPPPFPRRGIPYRISRGNGYDDVAEEEGLLFMCYNSDIEKQFEAVQRRLNRHDRMFRDFVTMRGGEYFFAPSISGLKRIGNLP